MPKINVYLPVLLLLIFAVILIHFFYFKASVFPINADDSGYSVGAVDYYRSLEGARSLWGALKEQKYCLFPNVVLSLTFLFIGKNWLIYKMVNLLYYLVLIYAVYFINKELGNRNAGILAAFMVSTMPLAIAMLRLNFPYYQLAAISLLALVFLIKSRFFFYKRPSILFGLFAGILLMVHHLASLYLFVILLSMLICASVYKIISFGAIDKRRITNFIIALCIVAPFAFFVSRAATPTYAREITGALANIVRHIFLKEPFYEPYGFNAIRYIAIQVSYIYICLIIIFTRPAKSYLSYWLFTMLFIFSVIFLFRSVGLGLDVGGTNFFIIFPIGIILFSNSFISFFRQHGNKILRPLFFIILAVILTNGALYIFPNNIDNRILNKKFLPHKNIISPPDNNNQTSVFLKGGMSALLSSPESGNYRSEISVSCNRWHPGMDALIFYTFLEHDIYIDAITEESPTRENYIYIEVLNKNNEGDIIAKSAVNGYYPVKEIVCYDEVFYFFRKQDSFNYARQEGYHAVSDNTIL